MEKALTRVIIKGKEWTPAKIKELILTNDEALKRALLRLYGWQTQEEQLRNTTVESNGQGFNGADAEILTSFAEQLIAKGWLSQKQIAICRKRLPKYAKQIFNLQVLPQAACIRIAPKFGL